MEWVQDPRSLLGECWVGDRVLDLYPAEAQGGAWEYCGWGRWETWPHLACYHSQWAPHVPGTPLLLLSLFFSLLLIDIIFLVKYYSAFGVYIIFDNVNLFIFYVLSAKLSFNMVSILFWPFFPLCVLDALFILEVELNYYSFTVFFKLSYGIPQFVWAIDFGYMVFLRTLDLWSLDDP